ncbi:MAG: hypothetical protein ACXAHE_19040 [Roseburia sp. 1XD42-69]
MDNTDLMSGIGHGIANGLLLCAGVVLFTGATALYLENDIRAKNGGYNLLLDKVFENNTDRYEECGMILMLGNNVYMEYGAVNMNRVPGGDSKQSLGNNQSVQKLKDQNSSSGTGGGNAGSGGGASSSGTGGQTKTGVKFRQKSFKDIMSPEEAQRYDDYWKQGAGSYKNIVENGDKKEIIINKGNILNTRQRLQTRSGIRSIVDIKYGENGQMYYRETIFDSFGRRIGNNNFTDYGTPHIHSNPHYHSNSPLDPQAHGSGVPGLHPSTP